MNVRIKPKSTAVSIGLMIKKAKTKRTVMITTLAILLNNFSSIILKNNHKIDKGFEIYKGF